MKLTPWVERFDIQQAPLDGTTLIEASAGTGKTYTLTGLFLRLLVESRMTVDRILVVTFTEAAAGELKERIRGRLRSALVVLSGGSDGDPFLTTFARTADKGIAIPLLQQAVQEFDRAAIFTIHGFCRRVLAEYAFETGTPFDLNLLTDTGEIKRSAVEDFWRRRMHAASPLFAAYALDRGLTPDSLLDLLTSAKPLLDPRILPEQVIPDTTQEESAFLRAFERLARAWGEDREAVCDILTEHPGLNRARYRGASVAGWIRLMDDFALPGQPAPLPFPGLEKFSASELTRATKKDHDPPSHAFFDLCDEILKRWDALDASLERALLGLRIAVFEEAGAEVEKKKAERNVLSFDDLLRNVHAALRGPEGERLAAALRSRFRAALIDEFQDTDPVQYGIFRSVFGPEDTPLFLIGDPKQAIYGFRGADVFAYLNAAREATRRATLPRNYRSEPGLVRAVNTLFEHHENPFALEDIPFYAVEPAQEKQDRPLLRVRGREEAPLRIGFLDAEDMTGRNGKIPKGRGLMCIPDAVAAEIQRLVEGGRSGDVLLGERPLGEGDIAVLLRTNREAARVREALAARRIPAALYTSSSLFDTPEAAETATLLEALAGPEREGLVRAALVTSFLGADGADLFALSSHPERLEGRLLRFRTLHETWRARGFYPMFRDLLQLEEVLPRLLRLPGGERRATNLLHLAEVLHQAETGQGLGPEGLIKWLSEQLDPRTRTAEEQPLRLESDGSAVKLVTIHKSKGLEYPIVFCPFVWQGSGVRNGRGPIAFHDPADHSRLTIDLGSPLPDRDRYTLLAENEILSENTRILYVALTRARNRCYLVWGRFNEAETSAPAYLFHAGRMEEGKTPVETSALRFQALDAPGMRRDLEALADSSGGSIRISPLRTGEPVTVTPPFAEKPGLSSRAFHGRIDRSWSLASFSSLTTSHRYAGETPDNDALPDPDGESRAGAETGLSDEGEREGFPAFPRGARAGTCLHAMFEDLDFTNASEPVLADLVRKHLRVHGFDTSWESAVSGMIRNVLTLPLERDGEGPCLEGISWKDRLTELSFFYPLNRVTPETLARLLRDHAENSALSSLPERIGRLRFAPARGFMRGFVDLVFRFEGRYYLLDWKSNDLGPTPGHYGRERLRQAMLDGLYHLQLLLYTLALDRYLALRLPGYSYERHFGGAYYVFLRGVDPVRGPGSGVHRELPSGELIRDLRKALIPGSPSGERRPAEP